MIGVCYPDEYAVEETFQLLKVPWKRYDAGSRYALVIGFSDDLSAEKAPFINLTERDYFALVVDGLNRVTPGRREPDVDLLIDELRERIRRFIPLVEVPPVPWGHPYMVALTHDVDITSVRERSWLSAGYAAFDRIRSGEVSYGLSIFAAKCRLSRDPWDNIEMWMKVEDESGVRSTFFFLPRPGDAGENAPSIRTGNYHLNGHLIQELVAGGWEVGVHGIDNWHDQEKSLEELSAITGISGKPAGNRVHWLLFDSTSPSLLESAGYRYDGTIGYNDSIGYPSGTLQAYRMRGVMGMLELPLHVQDLALLGTSCWAPSPAGWNRIPCMALPHDPAFEACLPIFERARRSGGCVTLLWHNVSGGSFDERLSLYRRLIRIASDDGACIGPVVSHVAWFEQRRELNLSVKQTDSELHIHIDGFTPDTDSPMFRLRVHLPLDRVRLSAVRSIPGEDYVDICVDRSEIVVGLT